MIFPWLTQLLDRAPWNKTRDISEADKITIEQLDAFFSLLKKQQHEFFLSGSEGPGRCSLSSTWVARILHAQSVSAEDSEKRRQEIAAALAGESSKEAVDDVFTGLYEAGTFEDSKNLKSIVDRIATIAKRVYGTSESTSSVAPSFLNNNTNSEKKGENFPQSNGGGKSNVKSE